jgi:hypothetical protein
VQRIFSIDSFYFLRKNLREPLVEKKFRISYTLEKLNESDWKIISDDLKSSDITTQKEYLRRLFFYKAGFKNCYVLKNKNGEITSMCWIIYPSENEKLRKYFKSELFVLQDNQVLLENVFTFPRFRGFGFSPAITTELLKIAKDEGYNSALAIIYSMKERITSLNDMMNIGFRIIKLVKDYRFLGLFWRSE